MFKKCGLIEKQGSGIARIKKLCSEHGLIEPKFEEIQKEFQVILYKSKQPTKAKNIAEYFNVTQRTIERYLK